MSGCVPAASRRTCHRIRQELDHARSIHRPSRASAALCRDAAQLREGADHLIDHISPHLAGECPDPYMSLHWAAATVAISAVEAEDSYAAPGL